MLCIHWRLDRAAASGAGYPDGEVRVESTWTPEMLCKVMRALKVMEGVRLVARLLLHLPGSSWLHVGETIRPRRPSVSALCMQQGLK
jgi:hypothetical protein